MGSEPDGGATAPSRGPRRFSRIDRRLQFPYPAPQVTEINAGVPKILMKEEISKVLTGGLVEGYAGKGNVSNVERATFIGRASHSEPETGSIYHDEWFVPSRLGGGQELVKVGEDMFTRLYGGGTLSPEELAELGITADDVGGYLKRKIVEIGDKTRLSEECKPEPDGDWQYIYEILMKDPNIPVVVSAESIVYKGTRVHLHPFIISPLK